MHVSQVLCSTICRSLIYAALTWKTSEFGQFTDHAIVGLVLDILAIQMNYTLSVDCYLVCMYLMSMIVSYCYMSLYLRVLDINDWVSLGIYVS